MDGTRPQERALKPEQRGLAVPVKSASRRFLDLLEPIRDQLYRYARRAAWKPDEAADILQEAVMTAWRTFDKFEQGTNFRAWVFQILVNTTFNFNKKVRRHKEVPLGDTEHELSDAMEREHAWSDVLHRPDLLAGLVDGRIIEAMDRLNEGERQCFLLRILGEFSYKEIATLVDFPVGTVMSHVHRARMKMREDLAALAVEQGLVRESVS